MGFFFSCAKLLLSNYTSALESLCNARGGGPGHVSWIKGIAEKPCKARREPCALATRWQEQAKGRGCVPGSGVWGAGAATAPPANFPRVLPLQRGTGWDPELYPQPNPRTPGWCAERRKPYLCIEGSSSSSAFQHILPVPWSWTFGIMLFRA